MLSEKFNCPVCGYPSLTEQPRDETGCPSFEICPCCGVQFGYQDAKRPHDTLRREWIAKGALWHCKVKIAPEGWNATKQLQSAGLAE